MMSCVTLGSSPLAFSRSKIFSNFGTNTITSTFNTIRPSTSRITG